MRLQAYAYACQCFNRIYRESQPVDTEMLKEAAEAVAVGSPVRAAAAPGAEAAVPTSNGVEDGASKRQKNSSGSWNETQQISSSQMPDAVGPEHGQDDIGLMTNGFSIASLRRLSTEQLATCGKLFDRASRVTGQEYLLLQSSLMDLSGLLQMQHQRLLELREEMQQFASAETTEGGIAAASNEQQAKEDTLA